MIDISLNWLDRIIESINFEKLPHGLIINGPNGIGKEFLSREIASRLLLNKTTKILDKELFKKNPRTRCLNHLKNQPQIHS